jgi:asparagine synthase (glutamine-hydrolysing)
VVHRGSLFFDSAESLFLIPDAPPAVAIGHSGESNVCGISGIFSRYPDDSIPPEWIEGMMDSQAHRGPDDSHSASFPGCALGFNRLSIQDVSTQGRQPMSIPESPLTIIFNGEIYNFVELARQMARDGTQLRSRSDTEVLLRCFIEKGESCLDDLNGMWSFGLYNPAEQRLFAARDRFGVKPFYYYWNDRYFCFASEIKALLRLPFVPRKPNLPVLFGGMFERANDRSAHTCFEGLLQLPPSHSLWIDRRRWTPTVKQYWTVRPAEPHAPEEGREEQIVDEFRTLLRSAVRLRLRSDRPTGLLLSGGIDSSTIAASLAALRSSEDGCAAVRTQVYTMSLPGESMDESAVAMQTARRLDLPFRQIEVSRPDFERLVPLTLWHNEEPLPLLNRCVHWHMMEQIAAEGVIVVLNGQGGDECTGGYFDRLVGSTLAMALKRSGPSCFFREWRLARELSGFEPAWLLGQFLKTFLAHRWVRTYRALTHERALELATVRFMQAGILRDHSPRLVRTDYVNDQLMRWLTRDSVPDLCHYEDRNSAAHGLEERFPYLDYRLVEFMFRLPWTFKTWEGVSKRLVRTAMRNELPETVINSHRKIGLGVPEGKWVAGPLASMVQDVAGSRSFRERGLWRTDNVRRMIEDHISGKSDHGNLIWRIVGTELWFRMFIEGSVPEVVRERGKPGRARIASEWNAKSGARTPFAGA